eukprot:CAMPEP_0204373604 /NCGR_PEP_ID=MMETSP0469-20131031/48159_1 /ASSEMBLY_ACC=CAM_ASM_000384 /TAXON_ID=2969 /ORGANISM="Oxyrrhis marina" /LENGTH=333 /DNA_ID=CAMNT_0051364109 /DNA_START=62 /DNA_END=1063 /DNA_ORIENTATION=+
MGGSVLSADGCGSTSALQRRCRVLQEQNAELRLAGLWRSRSGQVVAIEFGQVSGKYPIFDIDPELRQFSVAYGSQRFRGSFNACFETLWWEDGDVWRRFPLADAARRGLSDSVAVPVAAPPSFAPVPQPQMPEPRQTTPGAARVPDSSVPVVPQQPAYVATTSTVSDSPQSPKVATKAPPPAPPAATPPKSASSRVVAAPPAQQPAEAEPKTGERGFSRASTTAFARSTDNSAEAAPEPSGNAGPQFSSARPAAGSKGAKPGGPPPSGPPATPSGAPKAGKGAAGPGKGPPATPGRGPKPKGKGGGKRAGSFARGGMSFGTGGGSRDARPTFS